jgi:putative oxidoreductase
MRDPQVRLDIAALLLRVAAFLLLCLGHGTIKYAALMGTASFPDPLGIGTIPSVIMAMGAECVMSFVVAIGLFTRLSAVPILFTMGTVATLVHQGAPWLKREPSVLYLLIYTAILLLGPGRYSVDAWLAGRRSQA